jgi:hypothetical protein
VICRKAVSVMPRESFTCPRCGAAETDPVLASRRLCGICQDFTGRCGASFIAGALLATGVLAIPGWPYPCTSTGTERWLLARVADAEAGIVLERWLLARVAAAETGIGLCAPHGDRLRAGAASWMKALGLTLNPAAWS